MSKFLRGAAISGQQAAPVSTGIRASTFSLITATPSPYAFYHVGLRLAPSAYRAWPPFNCIPAGLCVLAHHALSSSNACPRAPVISALGATPSFDLRNLLPTGAYQRSSRPRCPICTSWAVAFLSHSTRSVTAHMFYIQLVLRMQGVSLQTPSASHRHERPEGMSLPPRCPAA